MFDYIKVEGFRSFKNVELDTPRLAVLIGPNGGGKSNFLDLLKLTTEAGRGQLNVGVNRRGGFRDIAFGYDASNSVRVEFHFRHLPDRASPQPARPHYQAAAKGPFDIEFRFSLQGLGSNFVVSEEHLRVVSPDGPANGLEIDRVDAVTKFRERIDSVPMPEEQKYVQLQELAIYQVRDPDKYAEARAVLQQFEEMTFYRDIDVGPESPVRQPTTLRSEIRLMPNGSNLSSVFHAIQQDYPECWGEILEIVHTAYPDFVKLTVRAEGGDGKVFLRWFERPYEPAGISANLLSDGMLKLLCLIAILKTPDPPPLICIDEPELGMHPDWIELVAELIQDAAMRTQVVIATHSPHIVAKMKPEQVIVVEKENGESKLEQLSAEDLEKWLKDFNLAELWLAGHFGGRP